VGGRARLATETTISRPFSRAQGLAAARDKILVQLQATRKQEHEAAMKKASALLKLSEMRGLEYQPARAAQAQVRCAANSR
jgi:hypothetical protein